METALATIERRADVHARDHEACTKTVRSLIHHGVTSM